MTDQQDLRARLLAEADAWDAWDDTHASVRCVSTPALLREAAAKLGRVDENSVGCLTISRWKGADSMVNHDFDYYGSLPDGSYSLYTRPQLPAGVPKYDRELIAEMLQDICYDDGYGMKARSTFTVESIKAQIDALRAADNRDAEGAHTAKRESGVPDGWVLVPREPTPEMLRAGFLSESEGFDIETPADAPGLVYRAMLAAAPKPDSKESR